MFGRDFCVDDLADLNKKRVTVHVNGDFENGKTLFMQAHWDMDEFLNAASNRLVVAATRVFNADGKELEDVMLAEEDDILFVSAGADFEAPGPTSPARGGPGIRFYEDDDASHLPATIGGYHVSCVFNSSILVICAHSACQPCYYVRSGGFWGVVDLVRYASDTNR